MIKSLFRISISIGLIGMAFGIFMGIRQDFTLAPAHASWFLDMASGLGASVQTRTSSAERC